MSDGKVIEFADVSMVFGDVPAVDGLTARVDPGRVTAFLGPNGAGKTTTLRVLLGDLRPSRGRATIGGTEYARIARPAASIGAVMTLAGLQKARRKTAAKHLERAARRIGVGSGRVREVLTIVGLSEMADMRIDNLSLGMKHRLAVAEALLGDPSVLVFDEPANGLDPEGIRWIRLLMRRFADEGRTVLMSSHVLSEVEQVADALLVLNQGELLFEGPIELLSEAEGGLVTVDADDRRALTGALDDAGFDYRVLRSGVTIDDSTTSEIGALAAAAGIALTTLTQRGPSLEDIYLQIIDGTWTAPARTAALPPAEPVDDADPAEAAADDESDVGASVPESPAADEPAHENVSDASADTDPDGDAPADDEDAGEEPETEDATDAEETDASGAEWAPEPDEPRGGLTGGTGSRLPGLAGLAGLAHGLRADDADGEDDSDAADSYVSPGLRAAFERAGRLERDAADIEAGVEQAEATAADDEDDWEAQLRSMFDDEPAVPDADAASDDNEAFPTANFDAPESR